MQPVSLSVLINHVPTSGDRIRNEIWRTAFQKVCHSICNASMSAKIEHREKAQRLQICIKHVTNCSPKLTALPASLLCILLFSWPTRRHANGHKMLAWHAKQLRPCPLPLLCHKPETLLGGGRTVDQTLDLIGQLFRLVHTKKCCIFHSARRLKFFE